MPNTTPTTTAGAEMALRSLALIAAGDTGPAVEEIIHPASVNHRADGGTADGPEGFRAIVRWLSAAFADITFTHEDVIACGDRVVARTRFRGLNVGPFQGMPPANRTVDFEQIHIWRIEDGLLAEHWACMDEVTALRQLRGAEA